ncbi:MAG TPA: thiamine phosphate synthase [Fredinandcohnia sp.]|nr:thiamine phosphate synthase [Fredinandcohnia sp.]
MLGFRLYLVTDRRLVDDLPRAVERALSALPRGAAAVQLREKDLSARALYELGLRLREVTARYGAPLLVNDRADVARAIGADGLHLPGSGFEVADARAVLGEGALVGASGHGIDELARRTGADFATFSPVFPSPGKGPAVGTGALSEAARAAGMPLFALGGVDAERVPEVLRAGAWGVAAIRAWLQGDPALSTARLWEGIEKVL